MMDKVDLVDLPGLGDPAGLLPDGWRWVKLGGVIAEALAGFASGERDLNGVIQLRMNNIDTRGRMNWNEFIRVPASSESICKYQLRPGDVMFNNTNSTELVGKSAYFDGFSESVVYSNHFTRLRARETQLDSRYLSHWLISQWQAGIFANICNRWIGQSAVKNDKLLALEIPLPPLLEQRRIAAILNEQLAAVEKARAAAEAQLQAAESLLAAYLREVFEGEEAKGWERVRLGELLTLRKEVIHPYDNPVGPAKFVGLEHIESGTGIRTGAVDVEMSQLTGRKPKFYRDDVVYGYLRPYLNKVWVAEFDGLCSVDQYVYSVATNKANIGFIAWFMRSATYLKRAPITTTPGQLPRIRTEEVASVEINLPSLDTQRAILAQLDKKLSKAKQTIQSIETQLAVIEQLPATLLRQAFRGEL